MGFNGARLVHATGDKWKKKFIGIFIYIFIYPISYFSAMKVHKKLPQNMFFKKRTGMTYFNVKTLTSRSLIAIFSKEK